MRKSRLLGGILAVFTAMIVSPTAHGAVSHDPVGHFDKAKYVTRTNTLQVGGWAADPDLGSRAGQRVMVSIDGKDVKSLATRSSRPDVARHYPQYGSKTGFARAIAVPKARGNHTVCIRAINRGAGNKVSVLLGCKTFKVTVPGAIIGHIDRAQLNPGNVSVVEVTGWVLNPYDAVSPTPFLLTGPGANGCADCGRYPDTYEHAATPLSRPDVDRQFPRNGSKHGFRSEIYIDWLDSNETVCLARVDGYSKGRLGDGDPDFIYPGGNVHATEFCAPINWDVDLPPEPDQVVPGGTPADPTPTDGEG